MDDAAYVEQDALGLAALIAAGEVSQVEVLDAALARAEAVNPQLNAIILPMYEQAKARAAEPLSGPLAGVPFLLKDLLQDYAGLPTSAGNRALRTEVVAQHSEVVRRWLDAGVVIMGKTNVPEFGGKAVTEPDEFGPTRNPWDLRRTPGGSSGGSAAAVAAGIVPAAGANDGAGSIRTPAACCGLVGLKPGRGRVPLGPEWAEVMHGAVVHGVLTRTVRDTAAFLDVAAGPEPAGPFWLGAPERSYADEVGREPGRLRIGFSARSPLGTPVHHEAVAAGRSAAELLESLGHDVTEAEPVVDGRRLLDDFLTLYSVTSAALVREVRQRTGCGADAFELDTRLLAAIGRRIPAAEYVVRQNRWHDYTRALSAFHADHDLLLTPTIAGPPVPIGALEPPQWLRRAEQAILRTRGQRLATASGFVRREVLRNLTATPFTQLANLTGRPALSVPLHWTASGLPLGVQFVAPPNAEGLLVRLASQLEQARPWAHRRPPLTPASR